MTRIISPRAALAPSATAPLSPSFPFLFTIRRHGTSLSLLEGHSPASILDVGCDDGQFLASFSRRFPESRLNACDMDEGPLKEARKACPNAVFFSGDFLKLKLPHVELVSMLEVLEHSPDPKDMLGKARSLIGNNGMVLVSIPRPELLHWRIIWAIWSSTFGRRWHGQHTDLTETQLVQIAKECGLRLEKRKRYFLGSISIMLLRPEIR